MAHIPAHRPENTTPLICCRLPQEILDAIVDNVDHKKTLKALSLSSKLFLERARRGLFGTFSMRPTSFSHVWHHFPRSQDVTDLMIWGRFGATDNILLPIPPSFQLTRELLTRFTRIQSLTFLEFPLLERIWPVTEHPLPFSFPSVKTLHMHRVYARSFSSIARILMAFPNLEQASLSGISWETQDAFREHPVQQRSVQTLDIQDCDLAIIDVLFPVEIPVHLAALYIQCTEGCPLEAWNPVLQRAGPQLKILSISGLGPDSALPANLSSNTSLTAFFLGAPEPTPLMDAMDCAWLFTTLSGINSRHMKDIHITDIRVDVIEDLQYLTLRQIDRLLADDKKFPALRTVKLSFAPPNFSYRDPLMDEVKAQMEHLVSRGLLMVSIV